MKKILSLVLSLFIILAATAFAECPQFSLDDYPVVDGSTATLPLSYALMGASTGTDEDTAKALISHSKTTESFYALCNDCADLLLVYEPSQDAYDYAADCGVELEIAPIGVDALVFLINDANPVTSLTHEQIVGIYTGEITNWKDVGGNDIEIVPFQRIANSGSQVMMLAQVMGDTPMMEAPSQLTPKEMDELVEDVAIYNASANAIGYSVYYYAHNMYLKDGVHIMAVNDVMPTNETIADGTYPYTQPFYAVIRADAAEDSPARQLYNWLTTDEGKALIENAGYVASK